VLSARVRLASLWVSQVARVLADWCLRLVAVLEWAGTSGLGSGSAWHIATAVFIAPFIVLAPLNGCLSNSLPRRAVLVGSALFTLLAVLLFAVLQGPWLICLGFVALGAAVYSPSRYAMLPAAANDCRLPLQCVNGWIEMGGAAAIVGGVALGWCLPEADWPRNGLPLASRVVSVLLGLNVLCLLTALPVAFPSDLRRPEPPFRAVVAFFRDCRRVLAAPAATGSVLALAAFQALVTAGSGALVAQVLTADTEHPSGLLLALGLVGSGAALGCASAALQGHLRRGLGFVAYGATGLLLALVWATLAATLGAALPLVPCFLLGFMGGLVNVPLRSNYLAAVPADARGNATAVMNLTIYVLTTALALLVAGLAGGGLLAAPLAQLGFLVLLAAVGTILAWRLLFSHALELACEWVLTPMYRVRGYGPGANSIPATGPLLIVANHSAYLDPFWVSKLSPRLPAPMMTSVFYDRPIIRWLMVHVVHAIRVPSTSFRREAPELREAIEVLRRGGCLLVFPEAMLRRKEDQLLRHFGQGVWHILREVPQTPVVICWIEGGWGSFSSYCNGPPMQDKRLDWARRIDIGVAEPQVLAPSLLADQRSTRAYLMRACLECRRYLGLEVPADKEVHTEGENPQEQDAPGTDAQEIGS
jgi:1-acyl-sn-glycerol-3-phosphate acyltransferase